MKHADPIQPHEAGSCQINWKGWGLWMPLTLCLIAACLAASMTWSSWTGASLIGCGPESGCAAVTGGRWAYLFGMPVSLLALAIHSMTIVILLFQTRSVVPSTQRFLNRVLGLSAGCLIGAALWFTGLQMLVIGQWCPYCVVTHVCGTGAGVLLLCGARKRLASIPSLTSLADAALQEASPATNDSHRNRPASRANVNTAVSRQAPQVLAQSVWAAFAAGLMAVLLMAAGQALKPPASHVVINATPGFLKLEIPAGQVASPATDPEPSSDKQPKKTPRLLSLHDASIMVDLDDVPMIGSPGAARMVVHLYDYTCQHCRLLHSLLAETALRFASNLAIVSLPTPLDVRCNPLVKRPLPEHTNACEIARLALAVWSADPQQFESFDDWIFSLKPAPTPHPVRAEAERRVGRNALDQALQSASIQRQLELAFRLYHTNYLRFRKGALPQILAGTNLIAGAVRDSNVLQRLLDPTPGLANRP